MGRNDGITTNQILSNLSRVLLAAASWLLVHYVSKIETSIDSHTKSIIDLQIAEARRDSTVEAIRADIQRLSGTLQRAIDDGG